MRDKLQVEWDNGFNTELSPGDRNSAYVAVCSIYPANNQISLSCLVVCIIMNKDSVIF